jgi:ribokinase
MITVFGSINVDFVTRVDHIPAAGETVLGPDYQVFAGGKGGNQALAAARAGAQVRMVGAVGDDPFAPIGTAQLSHAGVDLDGLVRAQAPTGAAFIAVSAEGENAIVVASGANRAASARQIETRSFGPHDLLLVQRELNDQETCNAMRHAKAHGARVILNAAPAHGMTRDWLAYLDYLIVNEGEIVDLGSILGLSQQDPDALAQQIAADHKITVVVTLGREGCISWSDGIRRALPALSVSVVDTTAAGDSFCGAFAAALDQGMGLTGALQHGIAAGSLACQTLGAQSSIPDKEAITNALAGHFI